MNEVITPRRTEYTNEGMEKTLIHLFRRLSRYNQLTILGAIEGKLDRQAEDAARTNHLYLVKNLNITENHLLKSTRANSDAAVPNTSKGKGEQRKRPIGVSAPSGPQTKYL